MPQLLAILDGGGDTVQPTAYERAAHPTLDALTQHCGMFYAVSAQVAPGSDYAHLTMLGADLHPRGVFEALGLGMRAEVGETAYKCVFARLEGGVVVNRRPQVSNADGAELVSRLAACMVAAAAPLRIELRFFEAHRFALVLGKRTAYENDPRHDGAPPLSGGDPEVQAIIDRAAAFLAADSIAAAVGVNYLLLRAPATVPRLRAPLRIAVASDAPVIRGIGHCLDGGLVRAVDWGSYARIYAARDNLRCQEHIITDIMPLVGACDLLVLHFEETDACSHCGDIEAKVRAIERIDFILGNLMRLYTFTQIIVTSDHTTSCDSRQHSIEPSPIAIWRHDCVGSGRCRFNERDCAGGDLGIVYGREIMGAVLEVHQKHIQHSDSVHATPAMQSDQDVASALDQKIAEQKAINSSLQERLSARSGLTRYEASTQLKDFDLKTTNNLSKTFGQMQSQQIQTLTQNIESLEKEKQQLLETMRIQRMNNLQQRKQRILQDMEDMRIRTEALQEQLTVIQQKIEKQSKVIVKGTSVITPVSIGCASGVLLLLLVRAVLDL